MKIKHLFNQSGILVLSAVITLGLFVFMAQLLNNEHPATGTPSEAPVIDVVQAKPEPIKPNRPTKLEPPKPLPDIERVIPSQGEPGNTEISPATVEPSIAQHTENFSNNTDTEALPLVQTSPQYPIDAAQNGKEGYVIVGFDISEKGTVINTRVIDANPKRIFDKAALQAVKMWKYKPKLMQGKAIVQTNQTVQLDFTLDQKI